MSKSKIPKIKLYHQEELDIDDVEAELEGQELTKYELRMYAMDDKGKEYLLYVDGIKPFFWVKVPMEWSNTDTRFFLRDIRECLGKYKSGIYIKNEFNSYETELFCKLYGFDNFKKHKFIKIYFRNIKTMRKAKTLWYDFNKQTKINRLKEKGYFYRKKGAYLQIYECTLPPMLKYFHEQNIQPSGWITFNKEIKPNIITVDNEKIKKKFSNVDYEYHINYKDIVALNIERNVPLKVGSWDIEAKSSHGDFPLPKKSYKKVATELINIVFTKKLQEKIAELELVKRCIYTAFGYDNIEGMSMVYLINKNYDQFRLENNINELICYLEDIDGLLCKQNRHKLISEIENKMGMYHEIKWKNELKWEGIFPKIRGDEVTMIGTTIVKLGEKEPYINYIAVVGSCNDIPEIENREIIEYDTEKELLLGWSKWIGKHKLNIMIGYYVFGFDWTFLLQRTDELKCQYQFLKNLSRFKSEPAKSIRKIITVASGTHDDIYVKMEGCLQMDLAAHFRKTVNLDSYKLDNVAAHYIGDKVKEYIYDEDTKKTYIKSKNLMGLKNGDYICFKLSKYSTNYYKNGKKFIVSDVNAKEGTFYIDSKIKVKKGYRVNWCMKKDDVTPEEMFNANTPEKRAKVAKYCIQDCNLVHILFIKNDIYTEFSEMANLCSVPLDYIIMRGQGIKCFSFINKKCYEKGVLVPAINKGNMTDAYEGAIVLVPKCGFYSEDPVAVNDYSSLYPSSMISENISHDSKVWWKEYDLEGNEINRESRKEYVNDDGSYKYDNLPGFDYVNIEYDMFEYRRKNPKAAATKILTGRKIVRFAQFPDNQKAVMPSVLQELLSARKKTKKLCKQEKDEFMKKVLDKRQLTIKLVANSLYGQTGAKTSSFYEVDIAASTTAIGRKNLMFAKEIVERNFKDYVYKDKYRANAEYVYGDTDSVFYTFNLKDKDTGEKIVGREALKITIELAKIVEDYAGLHLKAPHTLEYEKTFMPLLLLSKKRYVGMLYEEDLDSCYRKEMGIVLKRRDNAPCVKDCYGGVVDILMKEKNVVDAIDFVNKYLNDMKEGHISMNKLIITKKLNAYYKNPQQIAHKVLADRMTKRDPGNKPATGSRLPYVYIKTDKSVKLQGDKIESPDYVKKNNLQIDYEIYITNQLMKPLMQLFGLVLEQIPLFKKRVNGFNRMNRRLKNKYKDDMETYNEEITKLRDKETKKILFDPILAKLGNKKSEKTIQIQKQQNMMMSWCNSDVKYTKKKKKVKNKEICGQSLINYKL
tara:strand:+ start:399 stop:4181 length:3783 start_codon:yes stop_codon:yes gene_type:complete